MSATNQVPDAAGRFGDFGGRYVPETLTHALDELEAEYDKAVAEALDVPVADVRERAGDHA